MKNSNLNPVLFKDLMISLNGILGKSIIIFFIIIYFVAFLFILAEVKDDNFNNKLGFEIFQVIGTLQMIVLMGLGYLKGLLSISEEKSKNTLELLMITPLSSFKFIWGKLMANFLYIFLLFIISTPFLSIGLLLGGISYIDVFAYILYSLDYIIISILFGMFISSIGSTNIKSIILGIISPIIFIFSMIYFGVNLDFFSVNGLLNNELGENIFFGIFPIFLFKSVFDYGLNVLFLGVFEINFIIFHIIFYLILAGFFISYLLEKLNYYNKAETKEYGYKEMIILFVLSSIFFFGIDPAGKIYFLFSFFFLIVNTLFFLFNEKKSQTKKFYENYIFLAVSFVISLIPNIFIGDFYLIFSSFIFLVILLIYTLYIFLSRIFKIKIKGILNLIFIILISLIFYVIPALSSKLLEYYIPNLSESMRTVAYEEGLLDIDCDCQNPDILYEKDLSNTDCYYSYDCKNILKTNTQGYFIFLMFFILFFGGIGIINRGEKDF